MFLVSRPDRGRPSGHRERTGRQKVTLQQRVDQCGLAATELSDDRYAEQRPRVVLSDPAQLIADARQACVLGDLDRTLEPRTDSNLVIIGHHNPPGPRVRGSLATLAVGP